MLDVGIPMNPTQSDWQDLAKQGKVEEIFSHLPTFLKG